MKIRVEHLMNKSPDEVFDAIADHENYKNYPGFTASELREEGKTERNGEGALRELHAGGMVFKERITCFERPSKMSYHCEEVTPIGLRHDRGDITIEAVDGKTRVLWISEGHVQIPLIGSLVGRLMQGRIGNAFLGVLKYIDAH